MINVIAFRESMSTQALSINKEAEELTGFFILPPDSTMKIRILHAVKKPIQKMTVEEICRNCNISRRTFYNHFETKYSIYSWFLEIVRMLYPEKMGRSISLYEALLGTRRLFYAEKEFVYNATSYIKKAADDCSLGWQKWMSTYRETLTEYKHVTIDDDIENLLFGFLSLEIAFLIEWIQNGLDDTPEAQVDHIMDFVPEQLIDLFDPS